MSRRVRAAEFAARAPPLDRGIRTLLVLLAPKPVRAQCAWISLPCTIRALAMQRISSQQFRRAARGPRDLTGLAVARWLLLGARRTVTDEEGGLQPREPRSGVTSPWTKSRGVATCSRKSSALATLGAVVASYFPAWAAGQGAPGTRPPVIPGIGMPRSVTHVPGAGAVVEAISLEVPPGRRQFQPKLTLLYTSLSGLGDLGVGWQLDAGRLERSTEHGVPTFSGSDSFVFSINGSVTDLAPIGGNRFRARIETEFRQFTFLGDRWEMRDSQGTAYRFGTSPESRITDATWMLDHAEDRNGNTVSFRYRPEGGLLYLEQVRYTGHAPTGDLGANRIDVEYESRPDRRVSFIRASREDRRLRLRKISVFAGEQLVRRYTLEYGRSPSNGRSLLTRILLTGADGTSTVAARTYEYQNQQLGWQPPLATASVPFAINASDGRDLGVRSADVDGDNCLDLVQNAHAVWLGDCAGGFAQNPAWTASLRRAGVGFVDGRGIDTGARLLDVSGDLRPDIVVASPTRREVFLNDGTRWVRDSAFSASLTAIVEHATTERTFLDPNCVPARKADAGPTCEDVVPFDVQLSLVAPDGDSTGATFADVTGDGLPDIVWSFRSTKVLFAFVPDGGMALGRVPVDVKAVYRNTRAGWERHDQLSEALRTATDIRPFVIDSQVQGYDTLDVNGDGLADVIRTLAGAPRQVFLATGTGWSLDAEFTTSLQGTEIISLDGTKSLGLLPFDFNGDGLVDFIRANETVTLGFRNTGVGWVPDHDVTRSLVQHAISIVNAAGAPSGVLVADVNGDANSDLVQSKENGRNAVQLAFGPFPDLLARATTALGEVTMLTFASSTQFDNRGPGGVQQLPLVLPVARLLTRSDGRGHLFANTFHYAGGLFAERRFRGFALAEAVDPRGVTERSLFHQTGVTAGQLRLMEIVGAGGGVRSRKTVTYDTTEPVAGVSQVRVRQVEDETHDPKDSLRTRVRTSYDEFLNTVEIAKDGDVTVQGDEARTVMEYAKNLAAGITGLPSRFSAFGATGALLSRSITRYDNLPEGQVERGNPTSVNDFVEIGGPEVTRTVVYDAFGNIVRASDRAANFSTFEYDPLRHMFRTRATDPEGRVILSAFDPRFGVSILDIDPSGNATRRLHDAFGRLVREQLPGDECSPFGTRTIAYSPLGNAAQQFIRVSATETPGQPDTFDTVSFFDGFGQVYRIEAEGDGGRTVVLTTEFDDAGKTVSVTRPHFAGDAAPTTTFHLDALRRPVRITEPDGISHTIEYAGIGSKVTDRRGNHTVFIRNAYGKVVELHQFVAGASHVTRHKYDPFGQPVEITNALGELTRIGYDALGRRKRLDDPAAGIFLYRYDENGNVIEQTDPAQRVSRFFYNKSGQLTRKELSTGEVHTLIYGTDAQTNSVGRLVRVLDAAGALDLRYDPRGNVVERRRTRGGLTFLTAFGYDSMNRLRRVVYPDGFAVHYLYTESGFVKSAVDGNGQAIVEDVAYAATGQIAKFNHGNGVSSEHTHGGQALLELLTTTNALGEKLQQLRYAYDPVANVTAITDLAFGRSQTFKYDELHRLTEAVGSYGTEVYRYDGIGNLIRKGNLLFEQDPLRHQRVLCGIDLGLLESPANGIVNNPHLFTCASALSRSPRLRAEERVAVGVIRAQGAANNPNIGHSFAVTYDELGNVVEKNGQRFSHDGENRLVRILQPNGQLAEENIYDAAGQRVVQRTLEGEIIFIDGLFELGQSHASRHVRVGERLVATVVTPRSHVRLIGSVGVDPLSACKAAGQHGGCGCASNAPNLWPLALVFILIVAARRRIRRTAGRGGVAIQACALRFRARPLRCSVSALVAVSLASLSPSTKAHALGRDPAPASEKRFFYHPDHVGNPNVITDERGSETERREYKPFGEQALRTGAEGGPRLLEISFNGHRFDGASGLYYFGARHYDPVLGRFLSADIHVPDPENPSSLHRYVFNLNNPLRYADPTGQGFFDILAGIVLFLLVVVAVIVTIATGGAGFFGALAVSALVGFAVGVAVGLVGGGLLALAGVIKSPEEFGRFLLGVAIIGFLVGAAVGAFALAAAPAAGITEELASVGLLFVAGGSVIGGAAGFFTGRGFTETFLAGVLIGTLAGTALALTVVGGYGFGSAVAGFLTPALGTQAATAIGIALGVLPSIEALVLGVVFSLCPALRCSPIDRIGTATYGGGRSVGVLVGLAPGSPVGGIVDPAIGVPAWSFIGTTLSRVYAIRSATSGRAPFTTLAVTP